MKASDTTPTGKRWTASELRKLPPAERDAIMRAAAALAEHEYRNKQRGQKGKKRGRQNQPN